MSRAIGAKSRLRPLPLLVLLLVSQLLCGFDPLRTTVAPVEKGNALMKQGKPKEALEQYDRAVKQQPDLAGVHYNRALALEKLGKLEPAREALLRSTQSNDPALKQKSFYNLGNVMYQLEQYEEAINAYQNALRINPKHEAAKWNLELALRRLEEKRKEDESKKRDPKQQNKQGQDDQQKQDQQKQDQQNQDQQKQDQQKQDQQKQDQQKQDQQKQDQQKQDQQKQDQQKQDQRKQDQARQPQPRPGASEQRMQQLLDSLDRNDRNLQRWRSRMIRRRQRPPQKDW
jgi:tetratricopeptide (TPR) repeat protein